MRIAISTAVYYPQINGVAVFSHNLAVGLVRRGYEVMVICPSQNGKTYSEVVDGVKVCYLKSVDLKVYPDQIHKVPKRKMIYEHGLRASVLPKREVNEILTRFKPDVVHVQVADPIGLAVVKWARRNDVPVVTTEHNQPEVLTSSLKMPKAVKGVANKVLYGYFRNRHGKSDFVTMPTKQAIENLLGSGREFKVPIAAVSNGVDLSHFKAGRASKELYGKYGILADVPTALYVGRVDPEKKVGVVVEAFIRAGVPDSQLVIVGDGVDRVRLVRKYGENSNVKFLGRVMGGDLHELYKVGWVFVTASEIETQGIVLIEAAASGLPLVAVDAGAVAEVCIDGENGYLCEAGSVAEMAAAIKKILTDSKLRSKFSKKSVLIAKEHDFETTLDKFINIYDKVMI